jgi:transketolase
MGWRDLVGPAGEIVAIDHFGESAAGNLLFTKYGFTPEHVTAKAKLALSRLG